jgi:hypothetical protein
MVVDRRLRSFGIGLTVVLLVLPVLMVSVVAAEDLNLPSTMVTIEVSDGVESYFDTLLCNVPSGFDVENGTCAGWCVDVRTPMARSPAKHEILLYSSINPPGELAAEKWDMVNYILNHKQGNAQDVQQAIWYFVHMDGGYTPTRTVAWAIVNDTLANGEGFMPVYGEAVGVICYPAIMFPSEEVQISIIEVTCPVIPELQPTGIALLLLMATTVIALTAGKGGQVRRKTYR